MALYLFSCDLRGGNYDALHQALLQLGAKDVFGNGKEWALYRAGTSANELLNAFTRIIAKGDRIIVYQVSDWAAFPKSGAEALETAPQQ